MEHFAGLDVSVKETMCLHFGRCGQDRKGSEGGERASSTSEGAGESQLPPQADRAGSRAVIAMAVQRSRRSGVASDLCRDAARAASLR